jgi:hypothetical protein
VTATLNAQINFAARALFEAAYSRPAHRRAALELALHVIGAACAVADGEPETAIITAGYTVHGKTLVGNLERMQDVRIIEGDATREMETLVTMRKAYHTLSEYLEFALHAAPDHCRATLYLVRDNLHGLNALEQDSAKAWRHVFEGELEARIQTALREMGWIK